MTQGRTRKQTGEESEFMATAVQTSPGSQFLLFEVTNTIHFLRDARLQQVGEPL